MAEIPENQLNNLILDSIIGRSTETGRQRLADWASSDPVRAAFIREVQDPAIATQKMAIYLQVNPLEGYTRWLKYHRSRQRQKLVWPGAAAALMIAVALWWKLDVHSRKALPGLANTPAIAERRIANNTILSRKGDNHVDSVRTLPDGTKVWLNSQSNVLYPTQFTGKERVVELKGEAYFEAASDEQKPFVVKVQGGIQVQALSTSFDVMAYPEEDSVQTTLIKGSVRVKRNQDSVLLKAGQQITAAKDATGLLPVPRKVDGSKVVDWVDNKFYFPDHSKLKIVLNRIARWYHLTVIYKIQIPDDRECSGEIERDLPVEDILELIRYPGIKFRVINDLLIVEADRHS